MLHLADQSRPHLVARRQVLHHLLCRRLRRLKGRFQKLRTGPMRLIFAPRDELLRDSRGKLAEEKRPQIWRPLQAFGFERLNRNAEVAKTPRGGLNRPRNSRLDRYLVKALHAPDPQTGEIRLAKWNGRR